MVFFFSWSPPGAGGCFPGKQDNASISLEPPSHLCVYRHGCVYICQIRLGFGLNSVENGQIAFFLILFLNHRCGENTPNSWYFQLCFAAPEGLTENEMMAVRTECWKSCTAPQNPLEIPQAAGSRASGASRASSNSFNSFRPKKYGRKLEFCLVSRRFGGGGGWYGRGRASGSSSC